MPATPALSAPSAGAPFEQTTIERREPAARRRPHRHRLRRHLPLRHPPGPRRVGRRASSRWSPATRSPASSPRSAPRSPASRSATASASAASSTPAASASTAWPARSSSASRATSRPTTARDYDGEVDLRRLQPRRSSSTSTSSCSIPDGIELDVAAPLLCAGITIYSPLKHWGAGPGTKVAIVGMGGLGHIGVQDRRRAGRRGHRAQPDAVQAGGRPAASAPTHYYATSDRRDVQGAARAAST